MQKLLNLAIGSILSLLAIAGTAHAQTKLEIVHAWGGHARFHVPIAEAFMAQNPDIEIIYRAPMSGYGEGHQAILRQAMANDLPDIWYSPFNLLGELVTTLERRSQLLPLDDLLASEGESWIAQNYAPNVLALGQVDGKQWGMPFNASTPIVYYNVDLITAASGDPENPPQTWEDMITLGKKISSLGEDIDSLGFSVSEWGDDWLWQALVYDFGGTMMNAEKTEVTFGDAAGLAAVELLARLPKEMKVPVISEDQMIQQFAAGKLGMIVASTAEVRGMGELVGQNFKWTTGPFPIVSADSGLPTGGNAATILTTDPEKRKAAWEFIKFATGPEGQKIAVLGSGYMPTNLRTMEAAHLGDYYASNPDWTTSMNQWPVAKSWFGYPGNKGAEIWREQQSILANIVRSEVTPADGLAQLVQVTQSRIDQ